MRYDRIYSSSDGESHFDEVHVELVEAEYAPPASPLNVSEPVKAERALFFSAPSTWIGDSHPTPRRQLYIGLTGELEVTVSSGETRHFGPGSVVLLEDTDGAGHVTRVVGDTSAQGLFVHLE